MTAERRRTQLRVLIGTYTRGTASEGIYAAEWDESSGTLTLVGVAARVDNPSFLVRSTRHQRVYATLEVTDVTSEGEGAVASFELAGDTLHERNRVASGGGAPCALAFDPAEQQLGVANYAGTVAFLGISANGDVGVHTSIVRHPRGSVHPRRQTTGHPHDVTFVEGELWVPDLGADATFRYRVRSGSLEHVGEIESIPGSGPRFLVAHPTMSVRHLVHELSNEVATLANGSTVQRISTLAPGFTGRSFASDVHYSRDGHYLYVANRGEDSIVGYRVGADGTLDVCTRAPTGGAHPRAFALTPEEGFMLVANRDANAVAVLARNPSNGELSPPSSMLAVPAPACFLFV